MKTGHALILATVVVIIGIVYMVQIRSGLFSTLPSLEIHPSEAKFKRFGLIIDVRTPKEREELGFYPNSIPIAIQDLLQEIPFLIGSGLSSKTTSILVYDNGDRRAHIAAEMLYDMGYQKVQYLSTSYDRMLPGRS
jgi:rhodanese-related sulfurtransferase